MRLHRLLGKMMHEGPVGAVGSVLDKGQIEGAQRLADRAVMRAIAGIPAEEDRARRARGQGSAAALRELLGRLGELGELGGETAGAEHPHEAQQPEVLDVKSMNPKNTRSA